DSSSRLTESVLGGMVEGVVAVDHRERILLANHAARTLLDLPPGDLGDRPFWEVVRYPVLVEAVRAAVAGREQRGIELELPRRSAVVSLFAAPLGGRMKDEGGRMKETHPLSFLHPSNTSGAVLVLHDVTDLRRLENLRREFVANVSHELKTPLTTIQAYAETLLDGAVDDPDSNREFLRRIMEQSERLHRLILDLLKLARIESGRETFHIEPLSLSEAVAECVEAHRPLADAKGLTLNVECGESMSVSSDLNVLADRDGLRAVLDNLLSNAVHYTPEGGRVTVRCREEPRGKKPGFEEKAGLLAVIEVEDTGIGIAPEDQARIFERFYRVELARSRDLGGTGLGLSIVKHLVQVFGGRVDVTSQPGRGSTFT
ncbi:MAG: sensor histidine kinase, partial [Planctomycetaceae bacterium]